MECRYGCCIVDLIESQYCGLVFPALYLSLFVLRFDFISEKKMMGKQHLWTILIKIVVVVIDVVGGGGDYTVKPEVVIDTKEFRLGKSAQGNK